MQAVQQGPPLQCLFCLLWQSARLKLLPVAAEGWDQVVPLKHLPTSCVRQRKLNLLFQVSFNGWLVRTTSQRPAVHAHMRMPMRMLPGRVRIQPHKQTNREAKAEPKEGDTRKIRERKEKEKEKEKAMWQGIAARTFECDDVIKKRTSAESERIRLPHPSVSASRFSAGRIVFLISSFLRTQVPTNNRSGQHLTAQDLHDHLKQHRPQQRYYCRHFWHHRHLAAAT